MTSPFGNRISPVTGRKEFHNGIDIACETGTPAVSVADGTVVETGVSATFGKYLKYDAGGGYSVFYAHLSKVLIKEGEFLKKGQVIAETGSTGRSTGPHLHLTVYEGNSETDPLMFFNYFSE